MNDRGDRRPWQPWFDLHPPDDVRLAKVVAALDEVLMGAGFTRSSLGVRQIRDNDDRLHIRAAWDRAPLSDRRDRYVPEIDVWVGAGDGASVWGSGLIRVSADGQDIELLFRDTEPSTLAAMVASYLGCADAPYL